MTFVKFGPAKEFEIFNSKIQNMFNELPNVSFEFNYSFKPKADIYSDDKNIYVDLEVPGVKKDELKISLKDNVLNVSGEKKNKIAGAGEINILKNERNYGPFSRDFALSKEIDFDNIKASYEDGILKIAIQKADKKQESKREIKIN